MLKTQNIRLLIFTGVLLLFSESNYAQYQRSKLQLNQQRAVQFLDSVQQLDSSIYWPNVDPVLFMDNLRAFALSPVKVSDVKVTNFCAYMALTYLPLYYDPERYSRFMIKLFIQGEATFGNVHLKPGKRVRAAAGQIKYKGEMDINPMGQIWFLTLADHFKGYLNWINYRYDKGDENTFWASTNLAKFNRMLRQLFPELEVNSRGADIIKPKVDKWFDFLTEKLRKGPVFLYLNNRILYKKTHVKARFDVPTHYVVLIDIHKVADGKINFIYWDNGRKTLQQVTPQLLQQIIYGVTYCTVKDEFKAKYE